MPGGLYVEAHIFNCLRTWMVGYKLFGILYYIVYIDYLTGKHCLRPFFACDNDQVYLNKRSIIALCMCESIIRLSFFFCDIIAESKKQKMR